MVSQHVSTPLKTIAWKPTIPNIGEHPICFKPPTQYMLHTFISSYLPSWTEQNLNHSCPLSTIINHDGQTSVIIDQDGHQFIELWRSHRLLERYHQDLSWLSFILMVTWLVDVYLSQYDQQPMWSTTYCQHSQTMLPSSTTSVDSYHSMSSSTTFHHPSLPY